MSLMALLKVASRSLRRQFRPIATEFAAATITRSSSLVQDRMRSAGSSAGDISGVGRQFDDISNAVTIPGLRNTASSVLNRAAGTILSSVPDGIARHLAGRALSSVRGAVAGALSGTALGRILGDAIAGRTVVSISELDNLVDGYPDVQHELRTQTGGAPLEDGAFVTDHAVATPVRIRLIGWVGDQGSEDAQRAFAAWQKLRELHLASEPVSVTTPLAQFDEMLLLGVRDRPIGQGIKFEAQFEEVIRVRVAQTGALSAGSVAGPALNRVSQIDRGFVSPIRVSVSGLGI